MSQALFDNLQMQVEEYGDWRDPFDRLQAYASSKLGINIIDKENLNNNQIQDLFVIFITYLQILNMISICSNSMHISNYIYVLLQSTLHSL